MSKLVIAQNDQLGHLQKKEFTMKKNIPYPVIDMLKTGKNIQKIREEHGLSVNDVRRYINLDNPQAIYQWQRGIALPSVDHLLALSVLFEVKMEDILVFSTHSHPNVPTQVSSRNIIPFLSLMMCA